MSVRPAAIFVCALDWGLGHTTRTIPIIHILQNAGYKVILGGAPSSELIWKHYYPTLPFIQMYNHQIRYGSSSNFLQMMFPAIKSIAKGIIHDKKLIAKVQHTHNIKLIISDNRYGATSSHTPSVFIGHQLQPKIPNSLFPFKYLSNKLFKHLVSNFSEIWVPNNTVSQTIIHELKTDFNHKKEVKSIGLLSQFQFTNVNCHIQDTLVALLSGPEPHRTHLEKKLFAILNATDMPSIMVRGVLNSEFNEKILNPNLKIINFLSENQLQTTLKQANMIVARAGYSTIMDLIYLNKKSLLIPTPLQTEQEYLAMKNAGRYGIHICKQENLSLQAILNVYNKTCTSNSESAEFVSASTILPFISKYI